MDLDGKKSETENMNNISASTQPKSCTDCRTTRTPLWRGGPEGPKTLCNACGIKYNKKRRQLLGLDKGRSDRSSKKKIKKSGGNGDRDVGESLKVKLMALGGETVWQRSRKPRSKMGEEEQAAMLLMALSCGSVYA